MKWTRRPWASDSISGDTFSALDDPAARDQLKVEETRAFKTYRAREAASRRLGQRARAWNWALVAFSTSTTIAAIGMLTEADMYGTHGDTLMVCLAVLALVASLTTANMDYSARSRDMFINYRKLQRIAVEMEELWRQRTVAVDQRTLQILSEQYQTILDETENHTSGDHLRHFSRTLPPDHPHYSEDKQLFKARRYAILRDTATTALPYATLLVPAAVVVPLARSLML